MIQQCTLQLCLSVCERASGRGRVGSPAGLKGGAGSLLWGGKQAGSCGWYYKQVQAAADAREGEILSTHL